MFITFGYTISGGDSRIYALNTMNWTFIDSYSPELAVISAADTGNNTSDKLSVVAIVGITVGSLLALLILGFLIVGPFRKMAQDRKEERGSSNSSGSTRPIVNSSLPATPNSGQVALGGDGVLEVQLVRRQQQLMVVNPDTQF